MKPHIAGPNLSIEVGHSRTFGVQTYQYEIGIWVEGFESSSVRRRRRMVHLAVVSVEDFHRSISITLEVS